MLYRELLTCTLLNANVLKNIIYIIFLKNVCVIFQTLLNRKIVMPVLKPWENGHYSKKQEFILCIYKRALFLSLQFSWGKYMLSNYIFLCNMILKGKIWFSWINDFLSKATSWKLKKKEICNLDIILLL